MATLIFLQPSCDPYDFDPSAVGKEEKTRFALMDVTETALLDMSPSVNKEKKRTVIQILLLFCAVLPQETGKFIEFPPAVSSFSISVHCIVA